MTHNLGYGRWALAFCIAVLLGIALYAAHWLPLYPDEVAYKLFLGRYGVNGGFKQSVTPFCADGFLVRPPMLLRPAAWAWAAFTGWGSGFWSYRLLPYLTFGAFLGMLAWRVRHSAAAWPVLLLPTLGPALYGLMMLRPEMPLLSGGLALYLLAERGPRREGYLAYGLALAGMFSLALYLHPKALYLLPLMLLATILPAASFALKALMLALALALAQAALALQQAQFLSCAEAPAIIAAMTHQAVNPLDLLRAPARFVAALHDAFSPGLWQKSWQNLHFGLRYEIDVLPPAASAPHGVNLLLALCFSATGILVLAGLWRLCCALPFSASARLLALLVGLFLPFFLNLTRHFYEMAYFQAALTLAAAFAAPYAFSKARWAAWGYGAIMLGAACMSSYVAETSFTQPLRAGYSGPGIPRAAPRLAWLPLIQERLNAAHVPSAAPLIIDDFTCDAAKTHPLLLPISYLLLGEQLQPGLLRYSLARWQTHYGIARCGVMPLLQPFSAQLLATLPEDSGHITPLSVCLFFIP